MLRMPRPMCNTLPIGLWPPGLARERLRLEQLPGGVVARLHDRAMPLVVDADEPLRERRELGTPVLGAAARDREDRCAQDALHVADAIDARAIAHVALLARAPNRARCAHGLQQADVAWPDEELAIAGEPSLEARLHTSI